MLVLIPFLWFGGCATPPPPPADSPLIPLKKANLEGVFEEQEGLEILWENAQDVRDFYRGGVQQKAKADKDYRDKKYAEALKKYDSSDEFERDGSRQLGPGEMEASPDLRPEVFAS